MLFVGAILNFVLFIGHLACLPCLDKAFAIYGISGEMNELAATYGASAPAIITVIISLCFLACSIYAISGCGIIIKLPLLKLGLFTIATVYLLRGVWGITMMVTDFTCLELSSTLASTFIGLMYLLGGLKYVRHNGRV